MKDRRLEKSIQQKVREYMDILGVYVPPDDPADGSAGDDGADAGTAETAGAGGEG